MKLKTIIIYYPSFEKGGVENILINISKFFIKSKVNIILITSIAELIYFPSIPTKVSLNEYIEIAKEFSSPSSGKFVNGVIDNIVKDLTNKGLIVKKGRGLMS